MEKQTEFWNEIEPFSIQLKQFSIMHIPQHPNTPLLQYSITPVLHYSIPHHSITPKNNKPVRIDELFAR